MRSCNRQFGIERMIPAIVMLSCCVGAVIAQAPSKPAEGRAEVIGDDVYVRSGASANHYPVCKLNAGDRVSVVGETGEWLEILPPSSVFSFLSGDFVDTADGQRGVVNGNNVRVRAGSGLPDFQELRYVVQGHLSKGAEVEILGRDADGFLRIRPPAGVTVWINRQFVQMIPDALLEAERAAAVSVPKEKKVEADATPTDDAAASPDAKTDAKPAVAEVTSETLRSPLADVAPTEQRELLENLDVEAQAELAKPVLERQFAKLIEKYEAVATQTEDAFASQYARTRAAQLTKMAELVDTVRKMRRLSEAASSERRKYLELRSGIVATMPPIPSGVDAQGVLRVSALYPEGSRPRRYRLMGTAGGFEKTIAYVEVPRDVKIKIQEYIGQYVGVRAASKRLQAGGVNPVPIYLLGDLVRLDPESEEDSAPDQK